MKIKSVEIQNFRSIATARFDLDDYSLLVGPNNAGKSTVIDALRVFYGKDKYAYRSDRDTPLVGNGGEAWVEINFELLPDEQETLAEKYKNQNNLLRVRKYLSCDDASKNGVIYAYLPNAELSTEQFYGAKQVQQGKLGEVVYIPAVSKVDEHVKLTGPSALRDLLSSILNDLIESSDAFVELERSFCRFSDSIKDESIEGGFSLGSMEQELSKRLGEWGTDISFQISTPSVTEITKSLIDFQCRDNSHDQYLGLDQFGSGFQRHFIFSLIQLSAEHLNNKATTKSKEFRPQLNLLLFEEPEAFLHPSKQQLLSLNLQSLAEDKTWQVVCSTHSPHFVSQNTDKLSAIIRLQRSNGTSTAYQIGATKWKEIAENNKEIFEATGSTPSSDEKLLEMEDIKYCLFLDPDRCGMFFATRVLLVEGTTETAFIKRLIADRKIELPPDGLHVVNCMGKYNTHRFIQLLINLGIPHGILHDDDDCRGTHKEIHQLIRNHSHDTLTCDFVLIPKDLESFLGIDTKADRWNKPQHVVLHYAQGRIDEERVKAFCDMVTGLIEKMAPST